ncbi:MAG: leucyl/phenylalanyl-tRNA--protein transferase [Alphaproteobacteria bacterium]
MARPTHPPRDLDPELVLRAYAVGVFPMAEHRGDRGVHWVEPDRRGIVPLDRFHVPRRLGRTVASGRFEVRIDSAFDQVIRACAEPAAGRTETWINDAIIDAYTALHGAGHVHSVEAWRDGALVGGLYGVALGAAFFGESMFSRTRDASKVALVHLVERLRRGGFVLLDTQFMTEHLRQFGAIEVPRARYLELLADALGRSARF